MIKQTTLAELISQNPEKASQLMNRGFYFGHPAALGASMEEFCSELGLEPTQYMEMLRRYIDEIDSHDMN